MLSIYLIREHGSDIRAIIKRLIGSFWSFLRGSDTKVDPKDIETVTSDDFIGKVDKASKKIKRGKKVWLELLDSLDIKITSVDDENDN